MRKLLGFILIIGVVGLLVYSLHSTGLATGTQADARKIKRYFDKGGQTRPPWRASAATGGTKEDRY